MRFFFGHGDLKRTGGNLSTRHDGSRLHNIITGRNAVEINTVCQSGTVNAHQFTGSLVYQFVAPSSDVGKVVKPDVHSALFTTTGRGYRAAQFFNRIFNAEIFGMFLRGGTLRPPFYFVVARLHIGENRRFHTLLHHILTYQITGSLVGYLVCHERSHLSLHIDDTQIHIGSRITATSEGKARAELVAGVTIHYVVLVGITTTGLHTELVIRLRNRRFDVTHRITGQRRHCTGIQENTLLIVDFKCCPIEERRKHGGILYASGSRVLHGNAHHRLFAAEIGANRRAVKVKREIPFGIILQIDIEV